MKVLHLTLKKKWFNMIASGEKKEEYREVKPYWIKRLITDDFSWDCETAEKRDYHYSACPNGFFKHFDAIKFTNGYGSNAPSVTIKCNGINIRKGVRGWGAVPETEYFVIELGDIVPFQISKILVDHSQECREQGRWPIIDDDTQMLALENGSTALWFKIECDDMLCNGVKAVHSSVIESP